MLFEKLTGSPIHNRSFSGSPVTGLRTPQRYSSASSFGRVSDKPWQMRATYVEVFLLFCFYPIVPCYPLISIVPC